MDTHVYLTSERIQKKLAVPDKEWEKFKFAVVVMGRPQYVSDDDQIINIADFRPNPNQRKYATRKRNVHINSTVIITAGSPKPWIGLEHVNKAPKRSRFNYLEKAIKIYN